MCDLHKCVSVCLFYQKRVTLSGAAWYSLFVLARRTVPNSFHLVGETGRAALCDEAVARSCLPSLRQ